MKIPRRTSWTSYAASFVMLVGALGFAWFVSNTVNAADFDDWTLGAVSPDPEGMINLAYPETDSRRYGQMSHLMKNMQSSQVRLLRLGLYFPTRTGTNRVIRILDGGFCNMTRFLNQSLVMTIAHTGGTTRTYDIPNDRICPSTEDTTRVNQVRGAAGAAQNKFYVNYSVPNDLGAASFDERSGMYKMTLTFDTRGNPDQTLTEDPQQTRFKVAVTGSAGAKIGMLGGAAGAAFDFGLVASNNSPQHGVKMGIPFGMACDLSPRNLAVGLYDPDDHVFGPVRIWVVEMRPDGTQRRLVQGDYVVPIPSDDVEPVNGPGGNFWWRTESNGVSGGTSYVRIENAQPNYRYLMVIENPSDGTNQTRPNGALANAASENVFSVKLPSDAIYGDSGCEYNLTPAVDGVPASFLSTPDFDVQGAVTRSGGTDSDGNHPWELTAYRFDTRPAAADYTQKDNNINPSALHPGKLFAPVLASGSQTFSAVEFRTAMQRFTGNGGSYPLGTRFCFVMSVRKPSFSASVNTWRHSAMACSVAGKSPKMQVWGGDIRVGGEVDTAVTVAGGRRWGSWGEYGLFIHTGTTDSMASANGLLGGAGPTEPSIGYWSELTFANTQNGGLFGKFGPPINPSVPSTIGGYDIGDAGGNGIISDASGTPTMPCDTTMAVGQKIVCWATGTITIKDDIIFDGVYPTADDIPQLIIMAGNIQIDQDVKRVDAWLHAEGNLSTCSEKNFVAIKTAGLSSNECDLPLRFNGPVTTSRIYLYRTFGSNDQTDQDVPAETFNLRPDIYLSAYAGRPTERATATTDTIQEVAPRF